jgi:hypothetical protein
MRHGFAPEETARYRDEFLVRDPGALAPARKESVR